MKKINLFLILQIIVVLIFLSMFCWSGIVMFTNPAPTEFTKATFGELRTLFLGLIAWEVLKKKAVDEAEKIGEENQK